MKKILLIVFPLVLHILSFLGAPSIRAQGTPTVTIIGDSLVQGARDTLASLLPGSVISSEVGRQWATGIDVLNSLRSQGQLRPVLIYALGTNSTITNADVDRVIDMAPNQKIVFMTIHRPSGADAVNAVIQNAKTRYPDKVIIADWGGLASVHPEWFGSDGVHPNAEGLASFAGLLAGAAEAGFGGTLPNVSPPSQSGGTTRELRTYSNTVVVNVGIVASDNDLVKAGLDIKAAYDVCSEGLTYPRAGDKECLVQQLAQLGYTSTQVGAFEQARQRALFGSGVCVECLGFVSEAVALLTGDPSGVSGENAQLVTQPSITAGGITYRNMGSGINIKPEVGDIGIKWTPDSSGHAIIVKGVHGNKGIISLESNANSDCKITDTRSNIVLDQYTIFRKQ